MPSSPCAHYIVSTPPNTPPAAPAAQITSLVATVPREATARSGKNDTEDDVRYVRGSFTGHLQLLTVTVWLDLLYWRYSVQQGMDPPAVLKVKVAAQSCHPAISVRCTPVLRASWIDYDRYLFHGDGGARERGLSHGESAACHVLHILVTHSPEHRAGTRRVFCSVFPHFRAKQ